MSGEYAIESRGLSKHFGNLKAGHERRACRGEGDGQSDVRKPQPEIGSEKKHLAMGNVEEALDLNQQGKTHRGKQDDTRGDQTECQNVHGSVTFRQRTGSPFAGIPAS